jgi:hypothetical protein
VTGNLFKQIQDRTFICPSQAMTHPVFVLVIGQPASILSLDCMKKVDIVVGDVGFDLDVGWSPVPVGSASH